MKEDFSALSLCSLILCEFTFRHFLEKKNKNKNDERERALGNFLEVALTRHSASRETI